MDNVGYDSFFRTCLTTYTKTIINTTTPIEAITPTTISAVAKLCIAAPLYSTGPMPVSS